MKKAILFFLLWVPVGAQQVDVLGGWNRTQTVIFLVAGQGVTVPGAPLAIQWYNEAIYPNAASDPKMEAATLIGVNGDTVTILRGPGAQNHNSADNPGASAITFSPPGTFTPTPTITVSSGNVTVFNQKGGIFSQITPLVVSGNVIVVIPTVTPTVNLTVVTSTPTGSPTYTFTPTNTPTITFTPSWTNTPSFTNTISYTPTNSPVFTNSFTATPSWTETNSKTPTISFTPTNTLVFTNSFTPTISFTPTPSFTPTNSFTAVPPTNSFTPTISFTPTNSPVFTNTFTPTPSFTPTNSYTPTPSFTYTPSFTNTVPTNTPIATETNSSTTTPTFTPTPLNDNAGQSSTETLNMRPTAAWTVVVTPPPFVPNAVFFQPVTTTGFGISSMVVNLMAFSNTYANSAVTLGGVTITSNVAGLGNVTSTAQLPLLVGSLFKPSSYTLVLQMPTCLVTATPSITPSPAPINIPMDFRR